MFVYYKRYISIELTFLKELVLIRQANQKGAIFVNKGSKFQPNVCNRCFDLMMSMNFSDFAILNIKKVLLITVLLVELPKMRP